MEEHPEANVLLIQPVGMGRGVMGMNIPVMGQPAVIFSFVRTRLCNRDVCTRGYKPVIALPLGNL